MKHSVCSWKIDKHSETACS